MLDIVGGEGYEKFCPFLGKKILNKKFPHENIGKRP
ncbi:MAG: sulfotransferase [Promethearchaeota archaeon]